MDPLILSNMCWLQSLWIRSVVTIYATFILPLLRYITRGNTQDSLPLMINYVLEYLCLGIIFIIWDLHNEWFINHQSGHTFKTNMLWIVWCFSFQLSMNLDVYKCHDNCIFMSKLKFIIIKYFRIAEMLIRCSQS